MNKANLMCCITLLQFTLFSNAQDTGIINIKGIIKGVEIKNGTASLIPISLGLDCMAYKFDSFTVSIVNNHFQFSGTMPYPHGFEAINFNSDNVNFATLSFFLDSGDITMTCFYDSSKRVPPDIRFSKSDYEYQNIFLPKFNSTQKILDSFLIKRENDTEKYNNNIPDSVYRENLKIRIAYTIKRNNFLRQYIKQYPDSYIPLALLGQSVERMSYDIIDIENTFSSLSSEMRNNISGLKLKQAIELKNLNSLSDNLKMLRFMNEKNIKQTIDVHSNKYTLVDFWYSACKPCILQFPQLLSIYHTYKYSGFQIIGISIDRDIDDWENAISKHKINWMHLWDDENLASDRLLISSFPTNFLLDANGKIIEKNIEPYQLEEFLKENILKK